MRWISLYLGLMCSKEWVEPAFEECVKWYWVLHMRGTAQVQCDRESALHAFHRKKVPVWQRGIPDLCPSGGGNLTPFLKSCLSAEAFHCYENMPALYCRKNSS
eukprot:1139520-Pelagomonas_calceolata.AAC.3